MSLLLADLGNDGTGSHALSPFAVAAAGALAFVAVGESALSPFSVEASGSFAPEVTAEGTHALSPFAAEASGLAIPLVTGTATAALSPFAASASGALEFQATASFSLSSFSVVAFGENRRMVDAQANPSGPARDDRTMTVNAQVGASTLDRPARTVTVSST